MMMTTRFIIIILLLLACQLDLPERHYKSTDETTGGFNDFALDLLSDGTLRLTITTSIFIEEKETGTIWQTKSKTVTGNWDMKDERINYTIDEPKVSIDSIFRDSDFADFIQYPLLTFSPTLDTAYIYGISCLLTNK